MRCRPSLVLVTGPSRTGDIEQLLTLGAHGPTALHVVLVAPCERWAGPRIHQRRGTPRLTGDR